VLEALGVVGSAIPAADKGVQERVLDADATLHRVVGAERRVVLEQLALERLKLRELVLFRFRVVVSALQC
jgi:hypothetical protein